MTWTEEGSARTRPAYDENQFVSGITQAKGTPFFIGDGTNYIVQHQNGREFLPTTGSLTNRPYNDEAPHVTVERVYDTEANQDATNCQVAATNDRYCVVYESAATTPQIMVRVFSQTTDELVGVKTVTSAQYPRVVAVGNEFVFSYNKTATPAQIEAQSYDTTDDTFAGSGNLTTTFNAGNSYYDLVADATHFYVLYENTTPRLEAKRFNLVAGTITGAGIYTHATLRAPMMAGVVESGALFIAFDDNATNLQLVKVTVSTMVQAATITMQAATAANYDRIAIGLSGTGSTPEIMTAANGPLPGGALYFKDVDTGLVGTGSSATINEVTIHSKGFTYVGGPVAAGTMRNFMLMLTDSQANTTQQRHLLVCQKPFSAFTGDGWFNIMPVAVLTRDEADLEETGTAVSFPAYTVAESDTTNVFYTTVHRLTGFGAAQDPRLSTRTYKLDMSNTTAPHVTQFRDQAYVAGGLLWKTSAAQPTDASLIGSPSISGILGAGALTGNYSWRAVWEMTDSTGRKIRSTSTSTYDSNLTSHQVTLVISVPKFLISSYLNQSSGANLQVSVALYRTLDGGSLYYLVTRQLVEPAVTAVSGFHSIVDNDTDSVINSNELLRHGIVGGDLGPITPPASKALFAWRDRLCVISAENNSIEYSMPTVPERGPEFNPALSFLVPASPVAGAQLNNNAVIFSGNATYVASGSLANAAGAGQSISVQQLSNTIGCADANSVVIGNNGVYFQSKRGLELLGSDYKFNRLRGSDGILNTDGYTISSAAQDPNADEVVFTTHKSGDHRIIRVNETNLNTSLDIIPSTIADEVYTLRPHNNALRGVYLRGSTLGFLDSNSAVLGADQTESDTDVEIAAKYTTPWFQIDGPQGQQQVDRVFLKIRFASTGGGPDRQSLQVKEFYDHSTTASNTTTYDLEDAFPQGAVATDTANPTLKQLVILPTQQRCQAIRFEFAVAGGSAASAQTVLHLVHLRLEVGSEESGARVTPTAKFVVVEA